MEGIELTKHLQSITARLSDANNNSHDMLVKFKDRISKEGAVTPSNAALLAESVDQQITVSVRILEALTIIQDNLAHLTSTNALLTQALNARK